MIDKQRILAGRKIVETRHRVHDKLYEKGWYPEIHKDHTPILNAMVKGLNALGFASVSKFFEDSKLLNIQELGFVDKEDFKKNATEEDKTALRRMWK